MKFRFVPERPAKIADSLSHIAGRNMTDQAG